VNVALQQTARLLGKPVQPLEPAALHPGGGSLGDADDHVEGAANADGHRHAQLRRIHADPLFLLRVTKSHEKNIGLCRDNLLEDRPIHLQDRAGRGREHTSNMQARVALLQ